MQRDTASGSFDPNDPFGSRAASRRMQAQIIKNQRPSLRNLGPAVKAALDPRPLLHDAGQMARHPLHTFMDAEKLTNPWMMLLPGQSKNPLNNSFVKAGGDIPLAAPLPGGALMKGMKLGEDAMRADAFLNRSAALRNRVSDVTKTAGGHAANGSPFSVKDISFSTHHVPENPHVFRVKATGPDGKNAGFMTLHSLENGDWNVGMARVPEELRRMGIGREMFNRASKEVGGRLYHQTDPSLLSPEGAAFAKAVPEGKFEAAQQRFTPKGPQPGPTYQRSGHMSYTGGGVFRRNDLAQAYNRGQARDPMQLARQMLNHQKGYDSDAVAINKGFYPVQGRDGEMQLPVREGTVGFPRNHYAGHIPNDPKVADSMMNILGHGPQSRVFRPGAPDQLTKEQGDMLARLLGEHPDEFDPSAEDAMLEHGASHTGDPLLDKWDAGTRVNPNADRMAHARYDGGGFEHPDEHGIMEETLRKLGMGNFTVPLGQRNQRIRLPGMFNREVQPPDVAKMSLEQKRRLLADLLGRTQR